MCVLKWCYDHGVVVYIIECFECSTELKRCLLRNSYDHDHLLESLLQNSILVKRGKGIGLSSSFNRNKNFNFISSFSILNSLSHMLNSRFQLCCTEFTLQLVLSAVEPCADGLIKLNHSLIGLRWKHRSQTKTVSLRSLSDVWWFLAIFIHNVLNNSSITNCVYLFSCM